MKAIVFCVLVGCSGVWGQERKPDAVRALVNAVGARVESERAEAVKVYLARVKAAGIFARVSLAAAEVMMKEQLASAAGKEFLEVACHAIREEAILRELWEVLILSPMTKAEREEIGREWVKMAGPVARLAEVMKGQGEVSPIVAASLKVREDAEKKRSGAEPEILEE